MKSPFSLEGKTILITGASSGIGRAMAVACAEAGASLILTARNELRLQETLALLKGEGHSILVADITKEPDMDALVDSLPQLDGFVSNAGIAQTLMLQFIEKEDVDTVLSVNALATIHLTRRLLQTKKFNKAASVVFTSSINGNRCAYVGSTMYAASKAMLTGFMKAAALELAQKGIRVNSIEPGMIETDLLRGSDVSAEDIEKDKQRYPLKRYGQPEEVAWAAVYLLSDATRWMTGSALVLDGGYTLQ